MRDLTIIPLPDARLVPKFLVEQVKDREWSVQEWYDYQQADKSEANLLLGVINQDHAVVGFIWMTLDGFSKWVFINTLSVSPAYQGKRKLIKFVHRYIRDLAKRLEMTRVIWVTDRPRALEKYGYSRSDSVLMEVKLDGT